MGRVGAYSSSMDVIISKTRTDAEKKAGAEVVDAIRRKPDLVLGLATGSSPIGIYNYVAEHVRDHGLDVSKITCFALDEYIGLEPTHPESYHSVLTKYVTEQWGLKPEQVFVPDGMAEDPRAEAEKYEAEMAKRGFADLQIVGIGSNGHIGFNEPGSALGSRTRVKTLHPQTRQDNSRFFDNDIDAVPVHCITQGIGTVMDADRVLMIATGAAKAVAVAGMVEGPVAAMVPASVLQFHRRCDVYVDAVAGAALKARDYYDFVSANEDAIPKPRR